MGGHTVHQQPTALVYSLTRHSLNFLSGLVCVLSVLFREPRRPPGHKGLAAQEAPQEPLEQLSVYRGSRQRRSLRAERQQPEQQLCNVVAEEEVGQQHNGQGLSRTKGRLITLRLFRDRTERVVPFREKNEISRAILL